MNNTTSRRDRAPTHHVLLAGCEHAYGLLVARATDVGPLEELPLPLLARDTGRREHDDALSDGRGGHNAGEGLAGTARQHNDAGACTTCMDSTKAGEMSSISINKEFSFTLDTLDRFLAMWVCENQTWTNHHEPRTGRCIEEH